MKLLVTNTDADEIMLADVSLLKGRDGIDGKDGIHGKDGSPGPAGRDGVSMQGPKGDPGRDSYVPGPKGDQGESIVGPPGPKGEASFVAGPPGVTGPKGDTGPRGPAGRDGVDGKDGADGRDAAGLPLGNEGEVLTQTKDGPKWQLWPVGGGYRVRFGTINGRLDALETFAGAGPFLPLTGGTVTGTFNVIPTSGAAQVTIAGAAGNGGTLNFQGDGSVVINAIRYSNNASGAAIRVEKAGGTQLVPLVVQTGWTMGNFLFRGYTGASFQDVAQLNVIVSDPTPSPTAMGGKVAMQVNASGTIAMANVQQWDSTAWYAFGNSVILDSSRVIYPTAQAPGYQRITPSTGFTQTIANNIDTLIIHPAATLATGTIILPATPADGQEVHVSTSQTITTLTLSPNTSQSIIGATPTTLTAVTPIRYKYIATDTAWYPI